MSASFQYFCQLLFFKLGHEESTFVFIYLFIFTNHQKHGRGTETTAGLHGSTLKPLISSTRQNLFFFFLKKNEDKHFIYRFVSFFNRVCCIFRPIHGNRGMAKMKVSLSLIFITFLEIHLSDFCGAA